jgi:hypothetical protein
VTSNKDPDPLDALPPEMIQYGVRLALRTGSEFIPTLRWRDWNGAAQHGEGEINRKQAIGFWVFKESAV